MNDKLEFDPRAEERALAWAKGMGLEFRDRSLLLLALTHRSYPAEAGFSEQANEALEFLGDSVLSLIVTTYIYEKLRDLPVGELSKLRAKIVSEKCLFEVGKRVGIDAQIFLGKKEEENEGRLKPSIIADALEALIGAIYLDGGIERARSWVIDNFRDVIEGEISAPKVFDYKTLLQERAVKLGFKEVKYQIEKEEGPDHDKTFYASVSLDGAVYGRGKGKSKKQAEQEAAREAVSGLGREGPC